MLRTFYRGRRDTHFWPENGFAPVINAVLVLYIITAGLQMLRGTDWQGLTAQLYALSDVAPLQSDEYAEYSRQVARTASAEAVRQALAQAQIEAVVTMEDQGCQVELLHKEDRSRAEAVLAASCGELNIPLPREVKRHEGPYRNSYTLDQSVARFLG